MNIKTEKGIDAVAARHLRETSGLTQKAFWGQIGITQSGGCRYENGGEIPKPVRILLYVIHVAGLKIDASTEEGAADLMRLGKLQASELADQKEEIGERMQTVMKHVRSAKTELAKV